MAASMRHSFIWILRQKHLSLVPIRRYTIEPPEWMGGRSMLQRTGNYDFPEYNETFEARLASMTLHPIFYIVYTILGTRTRYLA